MVFEVLFDGFANQYSHGALYFQFEIVKSLYLLGKKGRLVHLLVVSFGVIEFEKTYLIIYQIPGLLMAWRSKSGPVLAGSNGWPEVGSFSRVNELARQMADAEMLSGFTMALSKCCICVG